MTDIGMESNTGKVLLTLSAQIWRSGILKRRRETPPPEKTQLVTFARLRLKSFRSAWIIALRPTVRAAVLAAVTSPARVVAERAQSDRDNASYEGNEDTVTQVQQRRTVVRRICDEVFSCMYLTFQDFMFAAGKPDLLRKSIILHLLPKSLLRSIF